EPSSGRVRECVGRGAVDGVPSGRTEPPGRGCSVPRQNGVPLQRLIASWGVVAAEREVRTADGRRLAGRSFGPERGRPVLFIAGAGTGKSMRFGDLDRANVRLITMDRPGMGSSDVAFERDLTSTAEDYRVFVREVVGDVQPPVVANSQGGVFGLAAAAAGWVS